MDKHIPKRAPLTRKIKRMFAPEKGKYVHGLYPEEYYRSYWLSHSDSNGVRAISRLSGTNRKATLHFFCEQGIKYYMRELAKKDLEAMATPEGRAAQASRTRFYLELRRLCREHGWDVNKLL